MTRTTRASQIREGIRARIEAGEWTDRLPSEPELGTLFGASRETVRKALGALEAEGLLARIHGKGTFVEASVAFNPLSGALSITEELARSGFPVTNEVLSTGWVETPRLPSAFLRQAFLGTARVFQLTRLRRIHGEPLALETSYFREGPFPGLADRDLAGSLHQLMTRTYGVRPDRVRNRIQALDFTRKAARDAAGTLGSRAMLQVDRTLSRAREAYYAVTFLLRTDLHPLEFTQIPGQGGVR